MFMEREHAPSITTLSAFLASPTLSAVSACLPVTSLINALIRLPAFPQVGMATGATIHTANGLIMNISHRVASPALAPRAPVAAGMAA
jgi:hypothetical protein